MEKLHHQVYRVGTVAKLLDATGAGSSMDWARGAHNIKYPYTVELRGEVAFLLGADNIVKVAAEAMEATLVIASYAAKAPKAIASKC